MHHRHEQPTAPLLVLTRLQQTNPDSFGFPFHDSSKSREGLWIVKPRCVKFTHPPMHPPRPLLCRSSPSAPSQGPQGYRTGRDLSPQPCWHAARSPEEMHLLTTHLFCN